MQRLTLLGATGSIGQSTLAVVRANPGRFRIHALTAQHRWEELAALCLEFQPDVAVVGSPEARDKLNQRLLSSGCSTQVQYGPESLEQVASAPECDVVIAAIVGAAGLMPGLAAACSGKRILLANKEALVMSGELFMRAVRNNSAQLLPIDSEHNAIFQCLPHEVQCDPTAGRLEKRCGLRRVMLTASGGPFLKYSEVELERVTPEQACRHPKWDMGRKISVDSATLMNKGLELIEACYLFGLTVEQVQVHVHPQAIIHSMVEYSDGSILAQLGSPDMRTPIANALAWPDRIESGVSSLDLFDLAGLTFEKPDLQRFPCLRLAAEAYRAGGLASTVLNAANEIAVEAFLAGQIRFTRIPELVAQALTDLSNGPMESLEQVIAIDEQTRQRVARWLDD
jgi:1-deoxy-D-xylulose-5-phosphate reductoisomerase